MENLGFEPICCIDFIRSRWVSIVFRITTRSKRTSADDYTKLYHDDYEYMNFRFPTFSSQPRHDWGSNSIDYRRFSVKNIQTTSNPELFPPLKTHQHLLSLTISETKQNQYKQQQRRTTTKLNNH